MKNKPSSSSSSNSDSSSEDYDKRYKQLKFIEKQATLEMMKKEKNQKSKADVQQPQVEAH